MDKIVNVQAVDTDPGVDKTERRADAPLGFNIADTALIFEGGGTRASCTAGVVCTLLEAGLFFKDVYGVSAGASHTANYISRDGWRAKASFVEFMGAPRVAGARSLLARKGYFNAEYIYQQSCLPGERLPFDFETFFANPADAHIEAYEYETDRTVCWSKADMRTMNDLMLCVRASSTMPFFMPPVRMGGHTYFDGALGSGGGLALASAKRDGYRKFFIVCTRERGYRKGESAHPKLIRAVMRGYPGLTERVLGRWKLYNAVCDEIDRLERDGAALVFRPERATVSNMTLKQAKLRESYARGLAQARKELPAWRAFLDV
jgi:predicted patatin/cPLA2 family phospholipase